MQDDLSLQGRLDILFGLIMQEYTLQGIAIQKQIQKLTWSMVCASDSKTNPSAYPELSSLKAAQQRALIGPMRAVVERRNRNGNLNHVVEMYRNIERFFALCESYEFRLPEEAAEDCYQAVRRCAHPASFKILQDLNANLKCRLWRILRSICCKAS